MTLTCKTEGCNEPVGRTSTGRCHTGGYCHVCKNLQNLYGINRVVRQEMFDRQDGLCAICDAELEFFKPNVSRKQSAAVDHCHKTGEVRGLLCHNCNNGLGRFKDSIGILNSAIRYLGGFK